LILSQKEAAMENERRCDPSIRRYPRESGLIEQNSIPTLVLLLVTVFFGSVGVSWAENPVEVACNLKYNESQCRKACAAAEAKYGWETAYSAVSHATQKICWELLRESEVRHMVGASACSAKACIYKLKLVKEDKKKVISIFSGSGYSLTLRLAPVPPYAGGRLFILRDTHGKITRFSSCGSCGPNEAGYESGPLKDAEITTGAGDEFVLRVPR
jgi:hypothetical protein